MAAPMSAVPEVSKRVSDSISQPFQSPMKMIKDADGLLCLGSTVIIAMLATNLALFRKALDDLVAMLVGMQLSPEIMALLCYLGGIFGMALVIDTKALMHMFINLKEPKRHVPQQLLAKAFSRRGDFAYTFSALVVTLNWMAASGLACSSLALCVHNPLKNYDAFVAPSARIAHDLVVGDLQINPLLRCGGWECWEASYGLVCACYLTTYYAFTALGRSDFHISDAVGVRGALYGLSLTCMLVFTGFFAQGVMPLTIALLMLHLVLLWFMCLQARTAIGSQAAPASPSPRRRSVIELMLTQTPSLLNPVKVLGDALVAMTLLLASTALVGVWMGLVYLLGKTSVWSNLLIYVPIALITVVLVRDGHNAHMIASCLLAMCHGIAHVVFPFLDEVHGVVRTVDVWQDQILHMLQAVLFACIWWPSFPKALRILAVLFVAGNLLNVMVGYFCWGQWCHEVYEWISLIAATSSGLHFAAGCFHKTGKGIAGCGFFLQTVSVWGTYFLFKSSDDILKLFAICRFFEIYFIVPNIVGFVYGRLAILTAMPSEAATTQKGQVKLPSGAMGRRPSISEVVGFDRTPTTPGNSHHFGSYFHLPKDHLS